MGHENEAHLDLLRRCFAVFSDLEEESEPELRQLIARDPELLTALSVALSGAFNVRVARAAAPVGEDPPLPARSSSLVQLPPPGRRNPEAIYREDQTIALIVKRAAGAWVEFEANGRSRGYELSNWVSKFHGGSRAFPSGQFRATHRHGRLFARFVG